MLDRPMCGGRPALFPAGSAFITKVADFARLADVSLQWRSEYVPLGDGPFSGRVSAIHTDLLQLACVDYSRGFSFFGDVPEHTYTFMFPLVGETTGVFRSTAMLELDIAAARFGEDATYYSPDPTRHLVISASELLMKDTLAALWSRERIAGGRLLQFADADLRLAFLRDAQRALAMALAYPGLLRQSNRARIFEARLIERLVDAIAPNARVARCAERHRLARLAHRYLLERAHESVSLAELCDALRANERTLLLGFVETYGVAPMAYLRGFRLNCAMRELRKRRNATVTEVASDWGFLHFGRFSTDYRKTFGESPRETLQNARAG